MTDILARRAQLIEEIGICDLTIEMEPDNQEWQDNREYLVGLLAEIQERIDNGELTEDETSRYLAELDEDDDTAAHDETTQGQTVRARRASLTHRITEALAAAPGWVNFDDLVELVQGRRLSEMAVGHAAVRKVAARLAWPHYYGQTDPPTVEIQLGGPGTIFASVRLIPERTADHNGEAN